GCVRSKFLRGGGQLAIPITTQHRQRTIDQVAESVCQLRIVTRGKTGVGPVTVRSYFEFPHDVKAKCIHAPLVDYSNWVDDVAGGLAQLLIVLLPPAVRHDFFREGQAHRLEHDWPEHRMEFQNVFANQVDVGRPKFGTIRAFAEYLVYHRIPKRGRNAYIIH